MAEHGGPAIVEEFLCVSARQRFEATYTAVIDDFAIVPGQSTDTSRGNESDREAEDILTSLLSFELYTLHTWRAIWLLSAFEKFKAAL